MMMIRTYSQGVDTSLSERKKKKLQKRIERLLLNLRHDRRNYRPHIELGDLYAALEEVEDADTHYLSAIGILRQGAVDEKARKQIIVLYGKIINLEPNNYDAYTQLGQEYVATGQKEKASRFLLSAGKKAFENGEYELALQCYGQVIDLGKSNPYIIERCTEIFLKLGRKDDAIENYVKIGEMYAREEKAVEALEYFKKASALDPDSPDLTLKVARMYYTLDWTENAAAEMIKIAEYHEQHRNFADALKYYQHSVSLDRENEKALAGKQRISASQRIETAGKGDRAETDASQEDVLDELDLIEDALKTQSFGRMRVKTDEDAAGAEPASADTEESKSNAIDASDIFSNGAGPAKFQQKAREGRDALKAPASALDDAEDFFPMDLGNSKPAEDEADTSQTSRKEHDNGDGIVWQDRLLDVNLEEDFILMTGFENQGQEDGPAQVPPFSNEARDTLEEGGKAKETELFDVLDLSAPAEQDELTRDVFEPVDAVAETADESPFEGLHFEDLQEEELSEDADAESATARIAAESPVEERSSDASPEADRTPEMVNLDDEAERLIADTLMDVMDEFPQTPENTTGGQADEPGVDAPVAERMEEGIAESTAHETDRDDLPSTYTAIKKPERGPREKFQGTGPELEQKLEDLEKQLENTEEEKYFLQEQFTAQIGTLKSQDTQLKREYERTRKDKDSLQQRLEELTSIYETARQKGGENDDARYEAIVSKIQQKKQALQQHVNTLLQQREQNGRFLAEELKALGATKLRLQSNLEYIQQVKARVEQKIHTDLRQAQEEIQQLSSRATTLESELGTKQKSEQHMQDQFGRLQKEKETLQDQFTETISALTEENEKIGEQLKELSKEKLENEHILKKKFKALYLSAQRLKAECKTSVQSKELELSRTAHRLSQFADEYVKLETTLKDIRKERDKLERMLVQETATRERLEDNLTEIESQVDSLEAQGSELLEQLDLELDYQLKAKQSTSDEFQESLGELEKLLVLQEKEIQNLEVF